MSDLRELYQEVIIDHNRNPRNFCRLPHANYHAEGFNPLCGDQLTLYLCIEQDVISEVSFIGTGCAISTASASLLTEQLKGKKIHEAQALFTMFHELITQENAQTLHTPQSLGKLAVLLGVREFPARVKCATLAWHTLQAALVKESHAVSTE